MSVENGACESTLQHEERGSVSDDYLKQIGFESNTVDSRLTRAQAIGSLKQPGKEIEEITLHLSGMGAVLTKGLLYITRNRRIFQKATWQGPYERVIERDTPRLGQDEKTITGMGGDKSFHWSG